MIDVQTRGTMPHTGLYQRTNTAPFPVICRYCEQAIKPGEIYVLQQSRTPEPGIYRVGYSHLLCDRNRRRRNRGTESGGRGWARERTNHRPQP